MSKRPSDGWDIDELCEEFDWMCEFNARLAEKIRDDADVHNLADYVSRLEVDNARLRDLVKTKIERCDIAACDGCPLNDQEACRYDEVAEGLGVVADRDEGTPFPLMPL